MSEPSGTHTLVAQADTEHGSNQPASSAQSVTGDRKELRGGEQESGWMGRMQRGKVWAL